METITIYKEIKTKEEIKLDIEDIRNCYLKDQDVWNNNTNYLGIWTDKAVLELVNLKNMIYKQETREENFDIQRKISSIMIDLNVKEVE